MDIISLLTLVFFPVIPSPTSVKGTLLGLRFATENPLKMRKNAFYFTLKSLFILKISEFLSLLFCRVTKQLG